VYPQACLNWLFFAEFSIREPGFRSGIRIEQFREAWILSQILEVGIIACLKTQLRVQTQRFIQMPEGIFDMASEAIDAAKPYTT